MRETRETRETRGMMGMMETLKMMEEDDEDDECKELTPQVSAPLLAAPSATPLVKKCFFNNCQTIFNNSSFVGRGN
jgi:hypothetical protein